MPTRIVVSFAVALAVALALGVTEWEAVRARDQVGLAIRQSMHVHQALADVQGTLTDAETGQRGYLVSGDASYLQPYQDAEARLDPELARVGDLVRGSPAQVSQAFALAGLAHEKMAELRQTVTLAEHGQKDDALLQVRSGQGERLMRQIRELLDAMLQETDASFASQEQQASQVARRSMVVALGASILQALLVLGLLVLSRRDFGLRDALLERETFLRDAAVLLSSPLEHQVTLSVLARLAVPAMADWCAIDMLDETGRATRIAMEHADPAKVLLLHELEEKMAKGSKALSAFARVMATGKPEFRREVPRKLIDDAPYDDATKDVLRSLDPHSSIVVPLIARGRVIGALTLVMAESQRRYTDFDLVTAQKLAGLAALAADNSRLLAEAHQANRVKDDFLSVVSHELRTPLTAILGWAHMLGRVALSPARQQQAAAIIQRNAAAQKKLIDDLLDVSRILAGKIRVQLEPLEVSEIVDAAIQSVQPLASKREVTIEKVIAPGAHRAKADAERIQQVVWNLLTNALKFTPEQGKVTVTLSNSGPNLELTVADNGQGISPEFLPHVFERFRQAETGTERGRDGLGLGLAIAKHLVALHGGTIAASSEGEGRGATFTVSLPRLGASAEPPERPAADAANDTPDLRGSRILLVEDHADSRAMVAELLEAFNAQVAVAESAEQAEAQLQKDRFDLLISDIALPGRDGYELVRSLRKAAGVSGSIPALALTAFAHNDDHQRALSAGFDAFLPKPIDLNSLLEMVESLLHKRAAN
ncbi:MAG: CHASE3 domain-containing protein [Deltaproteobacteria bacterium]|nr:CHASE3 domain-containing protein [Deltaproteobacteria bacterium]